eukprot:jgi/Botrbrau1/14267/Bobra.113_2s0013.1
MGAGPLAMLAYYRPGINSSDALVYDIVADLLVGSRTAWLYKDLVKTGKALSVNFTPSYPADKHACASLAYAVPAPGTSLLALERLLRNRLEGLASRDISPMDLQRIKKAARFGLLDSARSNPSMASVLASYHVLTGSWQNLFSDLAATDKLDQQSILDVATRSFTEANSFAGFVFPKQAPV